MKVIFWSPFPNKAAEQNIQRVAESCRWEFGIQVRVLHNYKKALLRLNPHLEARWDMVFIDCGSNWDYCVEELLRKGETAVINLPREENLLTEYFLTHHTIPGNILYLFNSSHQYPKVNKRKLEKIYRLQKENVAVLSIPVQETGTDRLSHGRNLWEESGREAAWKLLKMNCFF